MTHFLDNRGLEPPEPMRRTLEKLDEMDPGDTLEIHNDRRPMFLLQEVTALGFAFELEDQPDGTAKVRIRKA